MRNALGTLMLITCASVHWLGGCGSDNDGDDADGTSTSGSPEPTGAACKVADECFPDVADGALVGDALCLTDVRGGYCTHTCTQDEDCCAADGECKTNLEQVCSPFQSTGQMMCFLSCEANDIPDDRDEQQYCQEEASRDFICRSSGGGANNRKICVPGDCGVGAACNGDDDCSGELTCLDGPRGGYCTETGCDSSDDCPGDTACVSWSDSVTYCAVRCQADSDCSFCRGDDLAATCTADTNFIIDDDSTEVCVPRR